jgi:hypothetical protein
MPYVGRELGDEVEMVELPWRALVPFLLESEGNGLMVREDGKVASFQHVAEMHDGLVDSQQLSIVCAVFLPGCFVTYLRPWFSYSKGKNCSL